MVKVEMTARAVGLLGGVVAGVPESVRVLASFAARNPGIDPQNYGYGMDAWRAYRSESRSVSRDLSEVRRQLERAVAWGVTDADVEDATRGDRLTLERRPDGTLRVDYCCGQYWPTEYRKAVARVLRRAADRAEDRGRASRGVE